VRGRHGDDRGGKGNCRTIWERGDGAVA